MSIRVVAIALLMVGGLRAQDEPAPKPELRWVKMSELVYPQMARIAHIQGDVWVEVELDPAGNIVNTHPSGHPILIQAAMESLQRSKLVCENCGNENAVFYVRFRFKMPETVSSTPSAVQPAQLQIVSDPLPRHSTRSAKCLYLWKCSAKSKGAARGVVASNRFQNR